MEATQQPIVVGVDESDDVRSALRWTAGEAAKRGVPVRVVYAYHGHGEPPRLLGGSSPARSTACTRPPRTSTPRRWPSRAMPRRSC